MGSGAADGDPQESSGRARLRQTPAAPAQGAAGSSEGRRAELRAVSEAVLAVTSHLSVGEVLQTIVTSARQLLGAQYAALGVPESTSQPLAMAGIEVEPPYRAASAERTVQPGAADEKPGDAYEAGTFAEFVVDGVSDEQWAAIGPLPRQHGLLALLLRDPTPIRSADIRRHPQFGWWPAAHPTLVDFLGMPIVAEGQILGALYLANKPGGFTAEDEDLVRLIANHAAIALINARLYECVRELSIVAERNRIARELHDAVAQKLFSLRLTAEAAATLLQREPPRTADAARELATLRGLAAGAADELRAIVDGLRPPDLAGDGLDLALRKQVDLLDRVHGPRLRYTGEPVPRLPAGREEAVYRVAQEALHNALRHAAPTLIEVRLAGPAGNGSTAGSVSPARTASSAGIAGPAGTVVLQVSDDGRGFDPDAPSGVAASRRLGLASMRERARAVGGRLAVISRPGGGTRVRLEVPVRG